ncbi:MAG: hypothetical protein JW891_04270 [Candidatus Lokiarchaeota archaeon]|nr:hypothetical protein [Candidatus Lokiarchaeota archaeon]
MNGETTKFYTYQNTSGRVNIPLSVAKVLNWNHKDELGIVLKTIEGQTGLFLYKKDANTE